MPSSFCFWFCLSLLICLLVISHIFLPFLACQVIIYYIQDIMNLTLLVSGFCCILLKTVCFSVMHAVVSSCILWRLSLKLCEGQPRAVVKPDRAPLPKQTSDEGLSDASYSMRSFTLIRRCRNSC